jgi:ABC-type multidrug transport system ATPase subunit
MSDRPVLVMSQCAKSYRAGIRGCEAKVQALSSTSLRLRAGELTVVEAPAGAGKTTLLLCAAGLLQPDDGIVEWPALDSEPQRPPSGVAYIADRRSAYGYLTVREGVAYAATVRDCEAHGARPRIDEILEVAGLASRRDHRVGLLNDADRALLLLAFALVTGPRLMLVDEAGGPDLREHDGLIVALERIAAGGTAVIWATRRVRGSLGARRSLSLVNGVLKRAELKAVSVGDEEEVVAGIGDRESGIGYRAADRG